MTRDTDGVCVPSTLRNCAVTLAGATPRFWMMKVVSQPPAFFAAYGRKTRVEPELIPRYESASCRLVLVTF